MKTLKIKTKVLRFDSDIKWSDTKTTCPKCKRPYGLQLLVTAICYFNNLPDRKDIYVDHIRVMDLELDTNGYGLRQYCANPKCDWSEDVYFERK